MFNVEFLHRIREYEFNRILEFLRPSARILEIGGGTGYQARRLQEAGFSVASIDLPHGGYNAPKEFPVVVYDGKRIPFPDNSFDIVFSSNVLEHVPELTQIHVETRRVLRPNGYCVHVMPTGSWRFWTDVAHYVELIQRLIIEAGRLLPDHQRERVRTPFSTVLSQMFLTARHYAVVPRHGEFGDAFTEILSFSKRRWVQHFRGEGFHVIEIIPLGLFYTGHMVFGSRLSIDRRTLMAKVLGSACILYKVRPPR